MDQKAKPGRQQAKEFGSSYGDHASAAGRQREFKPTIVKRAIQLQLNQKGNTNEDQTNSRKHDCVSHIFHDAPGGSNANAGEHFGGAKN